MTTEQIDSRIELFMEYLDYRLDNLQKGFNTKTILDMYYQTDRLIVRSDTPTLFYEPILKFEEWVYYKQNKIVTRYGKTLLYGNK